MIEDQGASPNELMLAFCRGDQEEELEKLLEEGQCDVSYRDGAGNTAVHYAAKECSIGCLETLVNVDDIDLDIQNTLEGQTALHMAVKNADENPDMAFAMVELLIAGGANPRIADRNKLTPIMLVNYKHKDILKILNEASVEIDDSEIANDDEVEDDGSASESD
ncbi:ankyrin repeat-containing domain protein [Parasitella parasitica]|nr:ankyrin repeat-containing domain protein [Parasitella parasitica]